MTNPLEESAKKRTLAVEVAISRAMSIIEQELKTNDGVYPKNRSRLSLAEVCRRSGVHPVTLHGAAHRATTRTKVLVWLKKVTKPQTTGSANIRRGIHDRAKEWKDKHDSIAAQFKQMYSIEVVQRDKKIAFLQAENSALREQIASIRAAKGKVTGIRSTKKR